MIVHIFNDQKKFSKGYFQMLKDYNFDLSKMELIHYGKKDDFFETELGLKTQFIKSYVSIIGNIKMLFRIINAEKIVVHSLASPALLFYLSFSKTLQKKVTWIIWGKDLYFYQMLEKKMFYHHIYEWFRKKSFKNIGTIVTILKGDYSRLKQWYDVTGEYIECNMLYYYAVDTEIKEIDVFNKEKKTVLLGNSGSKTNQHINAIDKIRNCKNIDKVYCPLSYGGNKKYYKSVIEYGKKVLGVKFIPLTDFIPKEEYEKILSNVDVGIFNYNRQEGLGNIWMLMLMGKTIYINGNTSTGEFFNECDITYIDFKEGLNNNKIETLEKGVLKNNQELLYERINVNCSVEKWREILYK